ncbi:peptidase M24 [Bacteroidia bacterium]|nr:peptidase M24 [Bacteroidia bacterium]
MKNLFIFLFICFFAFAPCAHGANELAAVNAEITTTEKKSAAVGRQVAESEKNIQTTQKELVRAADKLDHLENDRAALKRNIADLDARRGALTSDINANRGRIADAAAGLLAVSGNPSFQTDTTREYILTSAVLTGVASEFNNQMTIAAQQIKELEQIKAEKTEQQKKLDATAKKYEAERGDLDRLLKTRKAQNQKLRSEQASLQQKLRELSVRAKSLAELTAGISSGGAVSADWRFSAKKLRPPVSGKLLRGFGEKSELGLVSDGWYIKTRSEALVTAPADGKVEFNDNFKGQGRVLILSHKNSYYSVLAGLGSSDVLLGQEVLAGEPIGRMPDDKHEMYLELRRGPGAVDPARLFIEP